MAGHRDIHDHFFRQAKRDGYVARSAYKLLEIQQKKKIIGRGGRVLDLGSAPGAWLQVACRSIGPPNAGGLVVGIDLKPVKPADQHWDDRIRTIVGDAFETSPGHLVAAGGGQPFDAVLSDMMGSTSGHHATDHFQSIRLARRALALAIAVLAPGGHCVVKVFEGELYPEFLAECRASFTKVKGFRPEASRQESREMFVVGEQFRPES